MSPIQRKEIEDDLKRKFKGIDPMLFQQFYERIDRAISDYRYGLSEYNTSRRQERKEVEDLRKMLEDPDPPVGQIKIRLLDWPLRRLKRFDHVTYRVFLLHTKVIQKRSPSQLDQITPSLRHQEMVLQKCGLRGWLRIAPDVLLISILIQVFAQHIRCVRSRSRGSTVERPWVVETSGGLPPYYEQDGKLRSGPTSGMTDKIGLIGALAYAWEHLTGSEADFSRDGKKPFSSLVHTIFRWLRMSDQEAMHAIREFKKRYDDPPGKITLDWTTYE